jgi:hypothetical protein
MLELLARLPCFDQIEATFSPFIQALHDLSIREEIIFGEQKF